MRWVDPGAIHLTLKFLGGVPAAQVPALTDALRRELAGQSPFSLAIGPLGLFPDRRAPRVVWLAVLGDILQLQACQRRVEYATESLGHQREIRRFQPHLTLGRVRENAAPNQLAAIGRLPSLWPADPSPPLIAKYASFIQSQLGPGGAQYTRLAELAFGG